MPPCSWIGLARRPPRRASRAWRERQPPRPALRPAGGPGRVVRRRAGRLHPYVQIGEPVLDRLEGADRPAELLALPGRTRPSGPAPVRRAHGLGGEQRRPPRPRPRRARPATRPRRRPSPSNSAGTSRSSMRACGRVSSSAVCRVARRARARCRPDEEEQGPAAREPSGVRGDQQQPARCARRAPGRPPRTAASRPALRAAPGRRRPGRRPPTSARRCRRSAPSAVARRRPVRRGPGQRAGGDARQQFGALRGRCRGRAIRGAASAGGGEQRRGQQRRARSPRRRGRVR